MGATSASWTNGARRVLAEVSQPGPNPGPSTTATCNRPRSLVVSATPSTITTVRSDRPARTAPTSASTRPSVAGRPALSGNVPASTIVTGHPSTGAPRASGASRASGGVGR